MTTQEKKLLRYLSLLLVGLLLAIGWLAEFIMQSFPLSPYRIGLRIGVILFAVFVLLRIMHLLLIRSDHSPRRKKWTTAGATLLLAILLADIPFMFIPYSHGNGNTYGSRIWFDRYWQVNSLGFRDGEPPSPAEQKPILAVLGDSFVAGHGVEDPADRFSDLLAAKMGDDVHGLQPGTQRRGHEGGIGNPAKLSGSP
jgi:hypothetical protein